MSEKLIRFGDFKKRSPFKYSTRSGFPTQPTAMCKKHLALCHPDLVGIKIGESAFPADEFGYVMKRIPAKWHKRLVKDFGDPVNWGGGCVYCEHPDLVKNWVNMNEESA